MKNDNPQTTIIPNIAYLAILFTLAWLVIHVYITMLNPSPRARLQDMVYGSAHKPFVYRTLSAQSIRALTPLVPLRLGVNWSQQNEAFRAIFYRLGGMYYPREVFLCIWLQWASLVAAALAIRAIMRGLGMGRLRADLLSLAFTPSVLIFSGMAYIYDLPTLALWSLCLLALAKERWNTYLVLFALANLQKETSILLALIFAVWGWKRAPFYGLLLSNQVGIALVTKVFLNWFYFHNPGAPIENHLSANLADIADQPVIVLISLAIWALAAWRIAARWPRLPAFPRQALIALPPMIALWLVGGRVNEIRVFLEVWPIVFLLLV